MKRSYAITLFLVAATSVAIGFTVAQYTSATRLTEAAPAPVQTPLAAPAAAVSGTVVLPDFADIAERANPAVVGITATNSATTPGGERGEQPGQSDPFQWFFGNPHGFKQRSMGSGFVISEDGYIFTNYHVVEKSSDVKVDIGDETLDAKIVGTDPETDLALLKVEPKGKLETLPLGDSDRLRVGEWVCAIGNPLLYEHTVTVGVVSAKGRRLERNSSFDSYIQTDAAINVGNSGGPLLNVRGEVIGINTAISSQGQNIGFAVPINMAKEILPQLRDKGKVVRGFLGVSVGNLTPQLQKAMKLASRDGALVQDVTEGEAAAKAGLKAGDVIVEVDGSPIDSSDRLVRAIATKAPGTSVRVKLLREGEARDLKVTLGERRGESVAALPGSSAGEGSAKMGISALDLTPRLRAQFRIGDDVEGVVVTGIDADGPASDSGLQVGDIIAEVNRKRVRSTADLQAVVRGLATGEDALLYVIRGGTKFWLAIPIGGSAR